MNANLNSTKKPIGNPHQSHYYVHTQFIFQQHITYTHRRAQNL